MTFEFHASNHSAEALAAVGAHLRADPLRNNVALTLLEADRDPDDQRCWWATDETGAVVGCMYQGPLVYPGVLSTLGPGGAMAMAAAVDAAGGAPLGRVRGVAGDVAAFAGAYASLTRQSGVVVEAFRMLAADTVTDRGGPGPAGGARGATEADREVLVDWTMAFLAEIGDPPTDRDGAAAAIGARFDRGDVVVWDVDGTAVSMASSVPSTTTPVTRIGLVYTPPEHRGRGHAGSVTAALTGAVLDAGRRPMLLTQLANPTSNAVYARIGYQPVAEELVYRFGD